MLKATKKGMLPLPSIVSTTAKQATVVPGLNSASLLSVPQLCDDDCTVRFDKNKMVAVKDRKIVVKGDRNLQDCLWDVHIPINDPIDKVQL